MYLSGKSTSNKKKIRAQNPEVGLVYLIWFYVRINTIETRHCKLSQKHFIFIPPPFPIFHSKLPPPWESNLCKMLCLFFTPLTN